MNKVNLTVTSTDKDVTLSKYGSQMVYAKNQVSFNIDSKSVTFTTSKGMFVEQIDNILCNGEQLNKDNAKELLSEAVFRKASGVTDPDAGGGNTTGNIMWGNIVGKITAQTDLIEIIKQIDFDLIDGGNL